MIKLVGRTIGVRIVMVFAVDTMAIVLFPFMSPMRIQCYAAKDLLSRDSLQPCVDEPELGKVYFLQISGYPNQKFFW
jgi:hypothetical protein